MPHPLCTGSSRNERQRVIDEWLHAHRDFVERETPTAIAREMKKAGLYSPRTALVDVRISVYRRCGYLGLPCNGGRRGAE